MDAAGETLGGVILSVNITDRKILEAFAEQPLDRFFRTDTIGTCIYINAHWAKTLGMTAEDAMGGGWLNTAGVGLSFVKGLIEHKIGGQMQLESPPEGAHHKIGIPREAAE